jgi:DNA-binding NtrC family response regulator
MANALVVDDDVVMCDLIANIVQELGHRANCVYTLAAALDEASSRPYDVVTLEINMPDGSGLDVLPQIRQNPSGPEVIIVTGLGDLVSALIAFRNGAWDYIRKSSPVKEKITLALTRALQYREEKKAQGPDAVLAGGGKLSLTLRPIAFYHDRMESQYLQELVAAAKGDVRVACRISGLSRSRLYALLKKQNIVMPGKGGDTNR